jgi:peptidoglycan hydrolase-like protein with peptidoglycan-binding domain
LRKGDRGDDVREMQEALMARGYDLGRWGADGIFGNQTLKALKAFQKDSGIKADGIVGRITYGKLNGEG